MLLCPATLANENIKLSSLYKITHLAVSFQVQLHKQRHLWLQGVCMFLVFIFKSKQQRLHAES